VGVFAVPDIVFGYTRIVRKVLLFLFLLVVLAGAGALFYKHWQQSQHTSGVNYVVSLGDSVAAGDGLLAVPNAIATDTACSRSSQAYPEVLAQQLNTKLLQYACSGARAGAGLLQPQIANGTTVPAQLAAAKPFLKSNDIVVTVGANDVGWSDMLQRCARSECTNDTDVATYQQNLQNLKTNLDTIFQTIQQARPHAAIVHQYYALLEPTDTCFASFGITTDKIQRVAERENELNNTIAASAKTYGITVVKIDFHGHLLCNKTPWVQSLLGDAPLHPSAEGQSILPIRMQPYCASRFAMSGKQLIIQTK
jgi:lysophospholipase L1-like esterase